MVQINFAKREVQCKIVFYGPARVGKTANLRSIHERSPAEVRGNLTTIATDTQRTLFFDYLPLNLGLLAGIRTKINLYAVPYLDKRNAVRLLVLEGVDGIVFVASRARGKLDENRLALENLRENLTSLGRTFEEIPIVYQWNFSDAPDTVPASVLQSQLNPAGAPAFEATATDGMGVFTTLKAITQLVLKHAAPMRAVKEAEKSADPAGALLEGDDSVKPQEKELPAAAAAEAETLEPVRMPSWHSKAPPDRAGDFAETRFSPPQEGEQPEEAPAAETPAPFGEEEADTRTGAIRATPKPHDDFEFRPPQEEEPAEPEPVAAASAEEEPDVGLRFDLDAPSPQAEEDVPVAAADAGEEPPDEPAEEQPLFSEAPQLEAEDSGPSPYEAEEPVSHRSARPEPEPEPADMGSRYVTVGPPSRRRRISQPRTQDGWHQHQEMISRPARDARVVVDRRRHPRSPEERFVPLKTVLLGAFAGAMSLSVVGYLVYVLL